MATYKHPSVEPWSELKALWIIFTPAKIKKQASLYIGTGSIELEEGGGPTIELMAPRQIAESIGHDWEPYDTIASRVSQALGKGIQDVEQFKNIGTGILNAAKNKSIAGSVPATPNPTRVDAPLMYINSRRREYTFDFELMASGGNSDTNIVEIVRQFETMSCPGFQNGIQIEQPYVFKISTRPSGFLNLKAAALTAVQPTYHSEYIYNDTVLPDKIDLSLTFIEIAPLFRSNFSEENTTIRTTLT